MNIVIIMIFNYALLNKLYINNKYGIKKIKSNYKVTNITAYIKMQRVLSITIENESYIVL